MPWAGSGAEHVEALVHKGGIPVPRFFPELGRPLLLLAAVFFLHLLEQVAGPDNAFLCGGLFVIPDDLGKLRVFGDPDFGLRL